MNKRNKKHNSLTVWCRIAYIFPILSVAVGILLLNIYPMLGFRWPLIAILVIINALLLLGLVLAKLKHMKKTQILLIVLSCLFGIGVCACDYLYFQTIHTMSTISTGKGDIVSSSLFVRSDADFEDLDSLVGHQIAVQKESSITMYEMLIDGIEEAGYSSNQFTLASYPDYLSAYEEFIEGKTDAIMLDGQSVAMLKDLHPDFDSQTKVIKTFTRIIDLKDVKDIDLSEEPFTILINGVDIRSGDLSEASNADVIMLATFNPKTMKLSLNSIPRDTYLPVTCRGFSDKITHSGSGGVQCTIDSIEQAFNIDIDYYVKVNFFAVIDLVDALGGIEVDVPFTFYEQDAYGNKNSIYIEEGRQTLNGAEALALSRHRKTLPNGDIDRGLNQQLVIQAILKKAASGSGVLNVDKLLKVVGDNIQTNIPTSQMYNLFEVLTKLGSSSKYGDLSALNIQMHTIQGDGSAFVPNYTSLELYFYMPHQSSIENTRKDIRRILGEEAYPLPSNRFAFSANLPYDDLDDETKAYLNPENATDDATLDDDKEVIMPDFTGDNYRTIKNWCAKVDAELPEGYYVSCEFNAYNDEWLNDDSVFVQSSIQAGTILSKQTLTYGPNPIQFTLENPQQDDDLGF